ncbi:hypothetical protein HAX54_013462 [Datura stramonium]|uniref:Secreted protein n=1 Tax=Datura stramonium TaxID=4076 RepID=A0ABS8TMV8_DATST|nr:hypothetical protein [Datura stramonium]
MLSHLAIAFLPHAFACLSRTALPYPDINAPCLVALRVPVLGLCLVLNINFMPSWNCHATPHKFLTKLSFHTQDLGPHLPCLGVIAHILALTIPCFRHIPLHVDFYLCGFQVTRPTCPQPFHCRTLVKSTLQVQWFVGSLNGSLDASLFQSLLYSDSAFFNILIRQRLNVKTYEPLLLLVVS